MEGYDLVMGEGDYEVAAGAINMEDITSDPHNQDILRRLKENDRGFHDLWVCSARDHNTLTVLKSTFTVLVMLPTWDGWDISSAKIQT